MNITRAILELRIKYAQNGYSPIDINSGYCGCFADEIADMGFRDCIAIWGDELPYNHWSKNIQEIWDEFSEFYAGGHCFIRYNNKYYDSQCPQGCNYPDELPYYNGVCLTVKYLPKKTGSLTPTNHRSSITTNVANPFSVR